MARAKTTARPAARAGACTEADMGTDAGGTGRDSTVHAAPGRRRSRASVLRRWRQTAEAAATRSGAGLPRARRPGAESAHPSVERPMRTFQRKIQALLILPLLAILAVAPAHARTTRVTDPALPRS